MRLLRIIKRQLPVGSKEWKSVVLEHELHFLGRDRTALVRKHSTPQQEQIPTADPECPEEVKLVKWIKFVTGNEAAVGDAEEEFNLEEVESCQERCLPKLSSF